MTGPEVLRGALAAPFRIWRTSLALLAVYIGAILAPMIIADMIFARGTPAFFDPSGADPVLAQHIMWFFGHPETTAIVIFVLMAVGGGASVGAIGNAVTGGRGLGWARMWRYGAVLWITFATLFLGVTLAGAPYGAPRVVEVMALHLVLTFMLYVFFRIAPALERIRADRALAIRAAWRVSKPNWRRAAGLAIAVGLCWSALVPVSDLLFALPEFIVRLWMDMAQGVPGGWVIVAARYASFVLPGVCIGYAMIATVAAAWLVARA